MASDEYKTPDPKSVSSQEPITTITLPLILSNCTCKPVALEDFQNYLERKEYSAENLMFFNWYQSYSARFEGLPQAEKQLSPQPDISLNDGKSDSRVKGSEKPITLDVVEKQPFRREMEAAIAKFIVPGSPYELNISSAMRTKVLKDSAITTHPLVLSAVAKHVYEIMESCSVRQFTSYALGNFNTPKQIYSFVAGGAELIASFIIYFLCIFLEANRAWRVVGLPFTYFASLHILGGYYRMCFQIYSRRTRQMYPWDLAEAQGPESTESYNSSPWFSFTRLTTTFKRNVYGMEVPIEDATLVKLQRRRFWKVLLMGLGLGTLQAVTFLAVPNASFK